MANAEFAAIEEEIREVLTDGDLTEYERNAALGHLVKRRREAFSRCRDLLRQYAPRTRGKKQDEADAVLRELLNSPEFAGVIELAMLFPVFMAGMYQHDSPLRGFPLPALPVFAPVPVYRPRF